MSFTKAASLIFRRDPRKILGRVSLLLAQKETFAPSSRTGDAT